MPARRFWVMEMQMSRIIATEGLQYVYNSLATTSPENLKKRTEELTLEIGETAAVRRKGVVAREEGAMEKLKNLM